RVNDGNRVLQCHVAFLRTKSLTPFSRLKETQSGYLRYHFLQQLDAFCPNVFSSANIDAYPSEVAAGPCETGDNAGLDWSAEDPDDRNRAGGRLKVEHK